jgi:hypothetical protein
MSYAVRCALRALSRVRAYDRQQPSISERLPRVTLRATRHAMHVRTRSDARYRQMVPISESDAEKLARYLRWLGAQYDGAVRARRFERAAQAVEQHNSLAAAMAPYRKDRPPGK